MAQILHNNWQFHHVDKTSIPQSIHDAFANGTLVEKGAYIGYTVAWPEKDKYGYTDHHLHLNCLDGAGRYLNPLNFFIPLNDTIPPEITDIYYCLNEEERSLGGDHLAGKVDIVVSMRDLIDGSPYELPVYQLAVEIFREGYDMAIIPYSILYRFDDLPGGADIYAHIYTVYKNSLKLENQVLSTCGNYKCRQFYYVVSNNLQASFDGEQNYWDLNLLPDGNYLVRIYAQDNVGNKSSRSFGVTVKKKKAYIRQ